MTRLLYKIPTRAFLALAVFLALAPFIDHRVLRMAGDEKVYVTQSVEMARAGRWFVQTLADEPSYFKGPLHYVLTRIGMVVFGDRIVAGTWMNLLMALLAGLAMHQLGRRRWNDKAGLLLGLMTALNVGVVSHSYASQMEVELAAFYAFAVASLGLARRKADFKYDLLFWLSAGMAGWVKSPLHSVLIGVSGLFYWALTSQLVARAKSPAAWAAAVAGVAAGVAGYLPAAIADWPNFSATFLGREQFEKANNHRTWDYVMKPLLHFALPWTFVVIAAIIKAFRARRKLSSSADTQMAKLGLAMCLPTFAFWCVWTYKGQNYNLPALPALFLFGMACFGGNPPRWAYRAVAGVGALAFLLAVAVVIHFWPLPQWWGRGWLFLGLGGMLAFSLVFALSDDVRALGAGAVAFFLSFGAMITPLGEREMLDIRHYVKENPDVVYHYYNLDPSIWSEWALLRLTVHHEIYGLHRAEQLAEATRPGHAVLVQNRDNLAVITKYFDEHHEKGAQAPVITPWTRWLTKGKTPDGQSRWKSAWELRDLSQLEREYFIVHFKR